MNRLSTASESSGGFSRTFNYDIYGNRWLHPSSTGPADDDPHEPEAQSNFSTSTNRLNIASSTYDNAGNQTYFTPYTLTFDAANRITAAESASNGDAYYGYDGNGRRVGKAWTPGGGSEVITYYIFDIAGRMVAEYTEGDPQDPELSYVFQDMLGSVRMVTDESGNVDECYDYTPFGRMLTTSDNSRPDCYPSGPSSYTSDLGDKFTGQQRDETRLDYFIARYYADGQGRFTSADPVSGWPADPQSWNMYAYARNNPMLYVDPTGMLYEVCFDYPDDDTYCERGISDRDFEQWLSGATQNYFFFGALDPLASGAQGWFSPRYRGLSGGTYDHYLDDTIEFPAGAGGQGGGGPGNNAAVGPSVGRAVVSLTTNSECRALFGSAPGGPSPQTLLLSMFNPFDTRYGQIVLGDLDNGRGGVPGAISNEYGLWPSRYDPSQGTRVSGGAGPLITVNVDPAGRFFTSTLLGQAQILMHETGHLANTARVPGTSLIMADDNVTDAGVRSSQGNRDVIEERCL